MGIVQDCLDMLYELVAVVLAIDLAFWTLKADALRLCTNGIFDRHTTLNASSSCVSKEKIRILICTHRDTFKSMLSALCLLPLEEKQTY